MEKVKCSGCKFAEPRYLTGYDRIGVFASHVCMEDIVIGKLVDAEVERECTKFKAIKQLEATNAQG